jgi:4-hydroxybenzoate polyprenyltransferase
VTRSRKAQKLKAYLRLCRPANLPTAAADVLAGAAVAAYSLGDSLAWHTVLPAWYIAVLALISVLLYAAGVVLNDYYDREIDAVERPERPIPSGVVRPEGVLGFGWSLALLAIGLAAWLDLRVLGLALLLLRCI